MKKIDNVIRFLFVLVIFELLFLQVLVYFQLITLVADYAFDTIALFIYNIIVYGTFIVYNLVIFVLKKLFFKKNLGINELSKKQIIYSLIITTCFIITSIFTL